MRLGEFCATCQLLVKVNSYMIGLFMEAAERKAYESLVSVLDVLVSDLFHRLTKIEGNLDDFEDEIFDERTKSAEAKKLIS